VLPEAIQALQDLGVVHPVPPATQPLLEGSSLSPRENRRRRTLEHALAEVEGALVALDSSDAVATPPGAPTVTELARWTRLAHRVRQQLGKLSAQIARAEEEQALLARYHDAFAAFARLVEHGTAPADAAAFHLVLRADQSDARPRLEAGLRALVGPAYESFTQRLASGETAMLLVVPRTSADRVERLLADTQIQEAPVPSGFGPSLADALPRMREREAVIPRELAALRRERDSLRRHVPELAKAQAALRDRLARTEAISQSAVTPHAFVLEGWLPMAGLHSLTHTLESRFGGLVVVEVLHQEPWRADNTPVVLRNPRLFRPFEILTRMLPLPRYGSIDPTPYVAVFFPMFFGLIVGDLGYGAIMALASLVLHRRSAPGSMLRAVAEVGGACALFSLIFGALFGELFGDLGRRALGLRPLWFNREVAIVPFLVLTISLGLVHLVLGLVLGALSLRRSHPRQGLGRGLSAVMLGLVTVAILAALEVLPKALLSPAAIALLIAFPVLVILEGVVAPVELLTTLGHVLSYARIMALGTASVMLAVVANRLAGAVGSVVVGVLFALLFHLVNFALALFSPTIHALRLHYVEFFGTFYSPGGTRYRPLSHWTPQAG
jgi:V/A-type H+-transporting ATPase subunit I